MLNQLKQYGEKLEDVHVIAKIFHSLITIIIIIIIFDEVSKDQYTTMSVHKLIILFKPTENNSRESTTRLLIKS